MKKLILLLAILVISGCSIKEIKETRILLGTEVTITVLHSNPSYAKSAINLAFNEIARIEELLSHTKNNSELYKLNKNGYVENISLDFLKIIKKSFYYSNLTNGAFDITVQPILDLYKKTFKQGRAPTREEIEEVLKLVNYEDVILHHRNVSFRKKGMKITLGGIAKGYAIDKAITALKKLGIKHALIDAGGDIRALGDKNGKPWRIALENPRNKREYITIINLKDKAIATSGDYERYFDEKKKFHHIINPKTGYSATELISVTIITDKAIDADALATAVFVLGPEQGLKLIESLSNVEGLLITSNKKIIKTSGFK